MARGATARTADTDIENTGNHLSRRRWTGGWENTLSGLSSDPFPVTNHFERKMKMKKEKKKNLPM